MDVVAPHPRSAEDEQLLRRIVGGDPAAVGELYDRYGSLLLGLAQRLLGRHQDAEEVVQEVFTRVWRQGSSYDSGRSSVATWLVLLTRSRAIDRLRSSKVLERTLAAVGAQNPHQHTSPRGVESVLSSERRQRVREALGELPREQAEVLELAFFQGMTQSEIAAATGIPLGTVKTRTLLAMKKLRAALRAEIQELL
jgi:RNA polymerase sigma-70 factor, ECF subfamily